MLSSSLSSFIISLIARKKKLNEKFIRTSQGYLIYVDEILLETIRI